MCCLIEFTYLGFFLSVMGISSQNNSIGFFMFIKYYFAKIKLKSLFIMMLELT